MEMSSKSKSASNKIQGKTDIKSEKDFKKMVMTSFTKFLNIRYLFRSYITLGQKTNKRCHQKEQNYTEEESNES